MPASATGNMGVYRGIAVSRHNGFPRELRSPVGWMSLFTSTVTLFGGSMGRDPPYVAVGSRPRAAPTESLHRIGTDHARERDRQYGAFTAELPYRGITVFQESSVAP